MRRAARRGQHSRWWLREAAECPLAAFELEHPNDDADDGTARTEREKAKAADGGVGGAERRDKARGVSAAKRAL